MKKILFNHTNMITIVIKKSPTVRLFDRMPLPRPKVRKISIPRRELEGNNSGYSKVQSRSNRRRSTPPFSVRVNRIMR